MRKIMIISTIILCTGILFIGCSNTDNTSNVKDAPSATTVTQHENKVASTPVKKEINSDTKKDKKAEEKREFDVGKESFSGLILGTIDTDVIGMLGEPSSKSEIEEWASDGGKRQTWTYANGTELVMWCEEEGKHIDSIKVEGVSKLKTSKGIGIGSTRDDVTKAYAMYLESSTTKQESIVVGSVYGGLIIDFKDDKVVTMFLGAASE